MSKKNNLKDFLTDVAHAIKTKVPDVATPINPQDFSNIVRSISGGGGEEEYDGKNTPLGVKPTSETWLLDKQLDSFDLPNFSVNFISNGIDFVSFDATTIPIGTDTFKIQMYYHNASSTLVYDSSWLDEAYRTITFLIPPTGDLLNWLQANGTKQSPPQ